MWVEKGGDLGRFQALGRVIDMHGDAVAAARAAAASAAAVGDDGGDPAVIGVAAER
ncbi:MAG: hypothetical protein J7482_19850 [Roseiflexus sp.]|nr:hypothetical protein [Roseiflexus sp.]